MNKKTLLQQLDIKYPIFQAPMAGVTTPDFVATVSQYGALGQLGAGYLTGEETKRFIKEVKQLTDKPFGINVFVPQHENVTDEQLKLSFTLMNDHLHELGESSEEMPNFNNLLHYEEQIEVVLKEDVPICSFTFGIPDEAIVKELKKRNIFVIGTATSVEEAIMIEKAQMNAVVVQGSEAGGHRGTFTKCEHLIGTMALVPQVVDNVNIPVIAAGGLMDGRSLMAALSLGAEAAQYGTAFLTTKECRANEMYKKALLQATEDDVVLTKAFSGKTARGIKNKFIESMTQYESKLPPFPYQNAFTNKMRQVAAKKKNEQFMSLWSGQAPRLTKEITVNELLDHILEQYNNVKKGLEEFD